MGPTRGPPGSCRPQMGPMLAPRILLSGLLHLWHAIHQSVWSKWRLHSEAHDNNSNCCHITKRAICKTMKGRPFDINAPHLTELSRLSLWYTHGLHETWPYAGWLLHVFLRYRGFRPIWISSSLPDYFRSWCTYSGSLNIIANGNCSFVEYPCDLFSVKAYIRNRHRTASFQRGRTSSATHWNNLAR